VSNESQKGESRSNYKDTLNLLKTSFEMRANAIHREPEIQRFWKERGIDRNFGEVNKGPIFTLHDGPPYANGDLHMGHALNKILKDIINKYQILQGRRVKFVPGWDCHGLPIELKVIQKLKKRERDELTSLDLRNKASRYALEQVSEQMAGFKRWGVWGEWDNPYLTLNKSYEAQQINIFGQMVLKGYIYRGLKPVHWSPSSRTALAEAELEYPEGHISQSIYVGFSVKKITKCFREELLKQDLKLPLNEDELGKSLKIAIWTTTPWTIPGNFAVSVNPRLEYSLAVDNNKNILIVAHDLISKLSKILENDLKSLAKISGKFLEGISYTHPLFDRECPVVFGGEYITTDSGTGLVHTAPGHGIDDFNTGMKYNLPIICVVDESGYLNSKAGIFKGLNVLKDANLKIINSLKDKRLLLKEEAYTHKYPYDWRTKKPTIFRATKQWFASIKGFRSEVLKSLYNVEWVPSSGFNRIESMIKDRSDWCISRQRTWGVPIPVFYEKNGSNVLLNKESLQHIEKLVSEKGSNVWWELDEEDLLPDSYKDEAHKWIKGLDTMDVWFDSGSSWAGVLSCDQNLNYPADLYLEGSDQHRGWFQSSILTSVAVNKTTPFKKVLTHGFVLDENGRKMSKSLGNIMDPSIIINGGNNKKLDPPFGADVLRLWVSSVDYTSDVSIGKNILKQTADVYRKVRNTARYLLGNLHDFDPSNQIIDINNLSILDRWMLLRTSEFIQEITESFECYDFSRFFQLIQNFCVTDLSNFYLDIAKDRLYVSAPGDKRRRDCQYVLSQVVESLAILISPVLCHMAEDIWQNIPYPLPHSSVFKILWPKPNDIWLDSSISEPIKLLRVIRGEVNRVLEDCRSNQKIGSSLQAAVRIELYKSELNDVIKWLQLNGNKEIDSLRDWLLVSNLKIGGENWDDAIISKDTNIGIIEVALAKGKKCMRCWHYENNIGDDSKYEDICERCIKVINKQAL